MSVVEVDQLSTVLRSTESAILERLVEPKRATLTPAAAKSILKLRFPASDVDKKNALARKARKGELTPAERDEIEGYERIGQFLSLMKSKARLSLRSTNGA